MCICTINSFSAIFILTKKNTFKKRFEAKLDKLNCKNQKILLEYLR